MTLRIVADVREDGTMIRLIGRLWAEHVEHVRAEIAASRAPAALDLDEVTLADVDAVRFLIATERQGIVLQPCAPFIREWMASEANEH
jgi:hypothetical protein